MIDLTASGSSSALPGDIRLSALSANTAAFLSDQVGKIISARVVKVLTELTSPSGERARPGNSSTPATSSPGTAAPRPATDAGSRYQVELNVNGQRLVVAAPLAPRRGQVLELQVLDAQSLRILTASTGQAAAAERGTVTANAPASPTSNATGTAQTVQQTGATQGATASGPAQPPRGSGEVLAQRALASLRSELPRQVPVESLPARIQASGELGKQLQQWLISAPGNSTATADRGQLQADNNALLALLARYQGAASKPTSTASTATNPVATTSTNPAASTSTNNTAAARQADRNTNLQNAVAAQAAISSVRTPQLTAQLQLLANQLQAANTQLPGLQQLASAAGIKQAIENSGVFYERKLYNQLQPIGTPNRTNPAVSNEAARATSTDAARQAEQIAQASQRLLDQPSIKNDGKFRQLELVRNLHQTLLTLQSASPARGAEISALWDALPAAADLPVATANSPTAAAPLRDLADALVLLLKQSLSQLARTQSQQWLSLGSQFAASEGQANQLINLVIPFLLNGQVQGLPLQIERETQSSADTAERVSSWTVRLRFDLEELGEMTVLASLREKTMNAVFWAEKQTLAEKIENEIAALKSTLSAAGLAVNHVLCRIGIVEVDDNTSAAQLLANSLLQAQA